MNSEETPQSGISCLPRWVKFALIGGLGLVIQLGLIQALTVITSNYLAATAMAVEFTILHNFVWHEKFTWRERATAGFFGKLQRALRFHVTNGVISIAGNLILMRLFAGQMEMHVVPANLLSVTVCSVANFLASDRWVFALNTRAAGLQNSNLSGRLAHEEKASL